MLNQLDEDALSTPEDGRVTTHDLAVHWREGTSNKIDIFMENLYNKWWVATFFFCPILLSSLPLYEGGLTVFHSLFLSFLAYLCAHCSYSTVG